MCVIDWLNSNSGFTNALLTLGIIGVTFGQFKAAKASNEVQKKLCELEEARDKEFDVRFVRVPNQNPGGFEEYKTPNSLHGSGAKVEAIKIKPDGSVKIKRNGVWQSYSKYIFWEE